MIIDVHCHMFNADDLPVAGFVREVKKVHWFGGAIARYLDRKIQDAAPDVGADIDRLTALLRDNGVANTGDPLTTLEETQDRIAEDLASDPVLLAELTREFMAHDRATGAGALGNLAWPVPDRIERFVSYFAQSRVDLPGQYAAGTGRGVHVAVPLLVDMDAGVHDRSVSKPKEQITVFDLLSQASMKGLLPKAAHLVLHPFIAFDPLRELAWRKDPDPAGSPLERVIDAVLHKGFVGVKVYPPMGWRPAGNVLDDKRSARDGPLLDEIVLDFARWCVEADVPVTAHCNDSNYAGENAGPGPSPD